MQVEEAGLEIIGCLLFGLLSLPLALIGTLARIFRGGRAERRRLIELMVMFVMGADRSQATVDEMYCVLLKHFARNIEYAEVVTAVTSFVPGGKPPFYDEARLAEAFLVFLRRHKISVPDAPRDRPDVWPPPPNPDTPYNS